MVAMTTAQSADIGWLLFDADGVLQQIPEGLMSDLAGHLGADPDRVLQDILAAEQQLTMTGGDFRVVLSDTLRRCGLEDADPEQVLGCWRMLEVDPEMTAAIRRLRQAGLGCALATNQQNVRVAHMRAMPEYAGVFDEQFYSSELGVAKPDPGYFTEITRRLRIRPDQALFLDDRDDNVAGARQAGLAAEVFTQNAGVTELDRILTAYGIGGSRDVATKSSGALR